MTTCAAQGCENDAKRHALFDMSEPRYFLFLCPEHSEKSNGYLDSCSISGAGYYQSQMFAATTGWCNTGYYDSEEEALEFAKRTLNEHWTGSRVLFDDGETLLELWKETR